MRGVFIYIAGLLSGLSLIALFLLINGFTYDHEMALALHDGNERLLDAIAIAGQLGRLDFISTLLALVAILMVFAALPIYKLVLVRCTEMLTTNWDTLSKEIPENVEEITIREVESRLPKILTSYAPMFETMNKNTDEIANSIGGAQDE